MLQNPGCFFKTYIKLTIAIFNFPMACCHCLQYWSPFCEVTRDVIAIKTERGSSQPLLYCQNVISSTYEPDKIPNLFTIPIWFAMFWFNTSITLLYCKIIIKTYFNTLVITDVQTRGIACEISWCFNNNYFVVKVIVYTRYVCF